MLPKDLKASMVCKRVYRKAAFASHLVLSELRHGVFKTQENYSSSDLGCSVMARTWLHGPHPKNNLSRCGELCPGVSKPK